MKCQSHIILKMSDSQSLPQSILMKVCGCTMGRSLSFCWLSGVLLDLLFGPKHDGASLHLHLVLVDGVQRAECTRTCSAHGWHQRRVLSVRKGGKDTIKYDKKTDLRSRFLSTQCNLSNL